MPITGTNSANKNMKLVVAELEVGGSPVTGDSPVAEDVTVDAPASDATWTDVQTALDDIASRLADLEAG